MVDMEKLLKDSRWKREEHQLTDGKVVKLKDKIKTNQINKIVEFLDGDEKEKIYQVVNKINNYIDEFLGASFNVKVQKAIGQIDANNNISQVRRYISDIIGECQVSRKLLNECFEDIEESFDNLDDLYEKKKGKYDKSEIGSKKAKEALDIMSKVLNMRNEIMSTATDIENNFKKQLQDLKTLALNSESSVLSQKTARNCLVKMSNMLKDSSHSIKNVKSDYYIISKCNYIDNLLEDRQNKNSYICNLKKIEQAAKGVEKTPVSDENKAKAILHIEQAARGMAQDVVKNIQLGDLIAKFKSGDAIANDIFKPLIDAKQKLINFESKLDKNMTETISCAKNLGLSEADAGLVYRCIYQAECSARTLQIWKSVRSELRKKIGGVNKLAVTLFSGGIAGVLGICVGVVALTCCLGPWMLIVDGVLLACMVPLVGYGAKFVDKCIAEIKLTS